MGRMLISHEELSRKVDALEGKYDAQFRVVFDAMRTLMEPPKPQAKAADRILTPSRRGVLRAHNMSGLVARNLSGSHVHLSRRWTCDGRSCCRRFGRCDSRKRTTDGWKNGSRRRRA